MVIICNMRFHNILGILQKKLKRGVMMKDGAMIQDRDLQRLDGLHHFLNGKWPAIMLHLQISIQNK